MRNAFARLLILLVLGSGPLHDASRPAWADAVADIGSRNRQVLELSKQGKYAEARQLAEETFRLAEKTLGPEHPYTLASVNNLGFAYSALGRYSEAEPLFLRALAALESALGREHLATLRSVNNLAGLYQLQGRYDRAEPLYQRALAGNEKMLGAEHVDTLTSANNLGSLYKAQGRYGAAEPLFLRALAGFEKVKGRDDPDTLRCVGNVAALYDDQGRDDEAEPLYQRALSGFEKALGPLHPDTLRSVNNLAFLYQAQGRNREAEPLFQRALAGHEQALGREHPDTLSSVSNLAAFYDGQDRYVEAEPLHQRALAGREKALGREHPDTITSIGYLAALYFEQGRLGEAEPLYERALADNERALGREHPHTLASVNNLGYFYKERGRHSEAETLYQRALAGREKALGRDHPDTIGSVSNLAALYFEQGDWPRAANLWTRGAASITERTSRRGLASDLTGKKKSEAEQSRSLFWGLVKATYRLTPQGRSPDTASSDAMFQTAQWALSSEAAQSLAKMAVRGAKGDPALARVLRERQDLVDEWQGREKLQADFLGRDHANRNADAEAENRERMMAIDKRITTIDAELKDKFPDYAALASAAPLAVKDVQSQLGADEALVLFLDTRDWQPAPEETFIWVVTRAETRWLRSDLGKSALAREVGALRCGLDGTAWLDPARWPDTTEPEKQRKTSQERRLKRCIDLIGPGYSTANARAGEAPPFDPARAHRLYQALFGEASDLIKGKHLLIVPSGALTQLPFSVLVSAPPQAGGKIAWLARDHAVTILPAVSSLKALRATARRSAAEMPLIGFGNPLLDGRYGSQSAAAKAARKRERCAKTAWERFAEFAGLRQGGAPVEMKGRLADPAELRRWEPLPDTADELCEVVRATGGDIYLGSQATERMVKELSEQGRLANYRILHFATHGAMSGDLDSSREPGLLLTPPDTASETDDGYLSASEIAGLKLDADWVILSACNTAAGGAASAEALSGLARAFIYAQARALLVSHWAVDSEATVKLITAAMREIARDKKAGRAEALRRAMLAMIDRTGAREAHPAYWAPFVVVGEGAY